MVVEKLLARRQGKGTFVAEHTQEDSLFRFFLIREPNGESLIPVTHVFSVKRRQASDEEALHLQLENGSIVAEIVRLSKLHDQATILETVIQPLAVFPDIDKETDLPNSLYTLYQEKYGISIVSVRDELKAVALPTIQAKQLALATVAPVLMLERARINIDGRVVAWSRAYCSSENFVYLVNLN
jgi:GntR family transcriptional regulator